MSPTVYLVTGANRGIGLGLVTALAARSDVIVFAGARSPSSAAALQALSSQHPGKVYILKLTSADREDNELAAAQIQAIAGKIDVVIANAGIANFWGPILSTPTSTMLDHYTTNVLGPLVLFQFIHALLLKSSKPVFAIITSLSGSIEAGAPLPVGQLAYGASKAGVNYFAVKLAGEFPELVVLPINPGPADTDMAAYAREKEPIMKEHVKLITVEECVNGILKLVDEGKREEGGVKMRSWDGGVVPW